MAEVSPTAGSPHVAVTVHVDAPAEDVYRLVADLTRMGEWSPGCTRVVWRGGAGSAAVGRQVPRLEPPRADAVVHRRRDRRG